MDQTVIGVFDTYDHADAARQQLIERGFAANDVQVRAHGADLEAASAAPGARTGDADTGFMESVRNFFADLFGPDMDDAGHYAEAVRRGGAVVAVTVASDDKVANAREALAAAGAFDIEKRVAEWRQSGYEGYRSDAAIYTTEEISTERARMNRESADMAARAPDSDTVRVVSRSAPGVSGSMMGTTADNMAATATSADYDDEFRSDWNTRYASTGGSYDDYAPAYRYGSTLGADSRYRDRPWDDIEPAARGDWQSRYPDSTWENFKDAVRYGWERVTGQR